ncbi:MAG TPA: UMP kinase [Lentimicrobium sp.]|nr:UMP kinase [Lentimicrobium sp.]
MKYKRILLKLSGEALMGSQQYGIDPERIKQYSEEISNAVFNDVQVAIVIGGGNIFRGMQGSEKGTDRVKGDFMGMLATIINGIALQAELEKQGIKVKLLSGIPVNPVAEPMNSDKAIQYLEEGKVIIIAGGTGNPFFTTDTAAVLRAVEIKADVVMKGTRVDGVYSADPEKVKNAKKYSQITLNEVYEKNLNIMDLTAITMCRENHMPIVVFNMNIKGNLIRLLNGEDVGTLVLL